MSPIPSTSWNARSVEASLAGIEPLADDTAVDARSREELASKIAHSFSNLLTVILGSTELAQREHELPPKLRKHLTRIKNASLEASVLCEELLTHFPPPRRK